MVGWRPGACRVPCRSLRGPGKTAGGPEAPGLIRRLAAARQTRRQAGEPPLGACPHVRCRCGRRNVVDNSLTATNVSGRRSAVGCLDSEEAAMSLMSYSIRIGLPTAVDPAGETGPGYWWVTGSARPGLLPESQRRATRRAHRHKGRQRIWRRGR